MSARITTDPTSGVVTLRYYDTVAREVRTRQFVVPADGGYVLELLAKGDCRPGYLTQGAPLIAESSAELADVIRREYRRMRAAERRLVRKDINRVLALYDVRHPAIRHAVKKLLMAGTRESEKDVMRDLSEARDAITRALVMLREHGWPEFNPEVKVNAVRAE